MAERRAGSASCTPGSPSSPAEPADIQSSKYRFYKPTTWFNAPKTAKYTKYDPGRSAPVAGGEPIFSSGRSDLQTEQQSDALAGNLAVWHGSLRRWKKCFVDARRTGLLVISRHTKRGPSKPWAFSLLGCAVMQSAKYCGQLAVHTTHGQLYLRAESPAQRERWLRAITASAAEFEQMRQNSESMLPGTSLVGDRAQAAAQSAVDHKVEQLVNSAMAALRGPIAAAGGGASPRPGSSPRVLPPRPLSDAGVRPADASVVTGAPMPLQPMLQTRSPVAPVADTAERASNCVGTRAQAPTESFQSARSTVTTHTRSASDCELPGQREGGASISGRAGHLGGSPFRPRSRQERSRSLNVPLNDIPAPMRKDVAPLAAGRAPPRTPTPPPHTPLEAAVRAVVTDLATRVATLEIEAAELEDALARSNLSTRGNHRDNSGSLALERMVSPRSDAPSDSDSSTAAVEFESAGSASISTLPSPGPRHAQALPSLGRADSAAAASHVGAQASDLDSLRQVRFLSSVMPSGEHKALTNGEEPASSGEPSSEESESDEGDGGALEAARSARTCLPNPAPLSMGISIWGILKSAIGKDLTKITLPATVNEPLSALQRLAEDMEQVHFLDRARLAATPAARMLWVALFAATPVNGAILRYRKPFNPLLGETFEWASPCGTHRFLAEQVSHHPPVACVHAAGPGYAVLGEMMLVSSFWGKAITMKNEGGITAELTAAGERYAWRKPTFTINNIILGKPWIEAVGTTSVTCSNGFKAEVTFEKCKGNLEARGTLRGRVCDASGRALYTLSGSALATVHATPHTADAAAALDGAAVDEAAAVYTRPPDVPEAEAQYHFTRFAIALNDDLDPAAKGAAPTDSRLRTDMRLLERADYDAATEEKLRLEDRQRKAAARRKEAGTAYAPRWFAREGGPAEAGDKRPLVKGDGLQGNVWRWSGGYWAAREAADWRGVMDLYS